MTEYFKINSLFFPLEVSNLEKVFEKDGKFYISETHEDYNGNYIDVDVEVFTSKNEAWSKLLKVYENHIQHSIDQYEYRLSKAIDDGWKPMSTEKSLEWIKNIKDKL